MEAYAIDMAHQSIEKFDGFHERAEFIKKAFDETYHSKLWSCFNFGI